MGCYVFLYGFYVEYFVDCVEIFVLDCYGWVCDFDVCIDEVLLYVFCVCMIVG